jgi:chromosomal replication initiator protein
MKKRSQNRAASSKSVPFLVMDENRFAYTAITSLAGLPDASQHGGVVFLHGRAGTGKSHLCDIVCHEWIKLRSQEPRVLDSFECQELLDVDVDAESLSEPAQKLAKLGLVVLEDIQQLVRHQRAQRSLCWLIDEFARQGTMVLITSVSSAGELKNCSARLSNRLRSGVTAQIKMPGAKSREELLAHFCSHLQIAIPLPVLRAFARELTISPRELLGVLLRFEEFAKMQRHPADLSFAREFLKAEMKPLAATVDSIAKAVAREFGVRLSDMKSPARDQSIMLPRQCAMYLAREILNAHFAAIGKYFGNRGHSTVLHAVNRIKQQLQDDAALRRQLNVVKKSHRVKAGD